MNSCGPSQRECFSGVSGPPNLRGLIPLGIHVYLQTAYSALLVSGFSWILASFFSALLVFDAFKQVVCKCWWGCREKGTILHCWWDCKLVQPLQKTVWGFLKKLITEQLYDPALLPLGIYPKKPKTLIQKDICSPKFIAVLFTMAKIWKQPKCPMRDEWIKKTQYIYTQWNIPLS